MSMRKHWNEQNIIRCRIAIQAELSMSHVQRGRNWSEPTVCFQVLHCLKIATPVRHQGARANALCIHLGGRCWCLADWTSHQGFFMRSVSCPCAIVDAVGYGRGILLCHFAWHEDATWQEAPPVFPCCWKNLVRACCSPSADGRLDDSVAERGRLFYRRIVWRWCLSLHKAVGWSLPHLTLKTVTCTQLCILYVVYHPIHTWHVDTFSIFHSMKIQKKPINISRFICSWAY